MSADFEVHPVGEWTCFHCGEVCHDVDSARLHFGASEYQQAGCQIDLAEYRRMEEANRRHCDEDTDLHRHIARMECEHQRALITSEEEVTPRACEMGVSPIAASTRNA